MKYTIVLQADEKGRGFTVTVPALPGCITQGRTKEEALANAREAIEGFIEGLRKSGDPVPEEKRAPEIASVQI